MTNRINYIDRMKGMAILVVVLAHVFIFSLDMADSLVFRFCASFEMPLFMFVSGFVAYLKPNFGGGKKLAKRFVAYVCPAFAVSYAFALYNFLVLGVRDMDVVGTLTGGFWYLKALAIFVCLQALLMKCRRVWLELLVIAVAEGVFLAGWKTNPFLHHLFCLEHCFFFYPFFMMGYYTRRYNLVDYLKSRNWIFTVSVIGFICLLNAHIEIHAFRFLSERILRPTFAILALTYLFALREDKTSVGERWLNHIGTRTLDIYMYHGILIGGKYMIGFDILCFDMRWVKDCEVMMANPVAYLLLALLMTVFLTYFSMAVGDLVRKSNWLEKVVYGKFEVLRNAAR